MIQHLFAVILSPFLLFSFVDALVASHNEQLQNKKKQKKLKLLLLLVLYKHRSHNLGLF